MELPKPEVVRCFFERGPDAPLSAMELRWHADGPGVAERTWHLPGGLTLKGPAPDRFGVTIHRHEHDAYHVGVVWNDMRLTWDDLTRLQIMTSSLALILGAMGTDLWYLLEQEIRQPVAA